MDPEIRETIMGHWYRGTNVNERYGRISDQELVDAIDVMTVDHSNTEILLSRDGKENPDQGLESESGSLRTTRVQTGLSPIVSRQ